MAEQTEVGGAPGEGGTPAGRAAARVPGPAAGARRPAEGGPPAPSAATAAPTASAAPARARLYGIDGLRFLAAAGVMLYHYTVRWSTVWGGEPGALFGDLGPWVIYASLAPELFFVVSGFMILMTAWGRDVPQVVASRVARLYPSYWVAVVLTSVLLLWVWPDGKDITVGQALVNLTMVHPLFEVDHVDGVYWTLWTELRFYVLVVVLVAIGITRRRVLAFCAAWPLAAEAAARLELDYASMFLIHGYAPLFAGGMLLYLVYREGHTPLTWLLIAGNVALALREVVPAQLTSITDQTIFTPVPAVVGAVLVGCFAAVAVLTLTPIRALPWRWLASLGALTYPLYLIHEHWGWWLIQQLYPGLGRWPTLFLTCAAAVTAAWLIHHGVERRVGLPMRRAIERGLRRRS
ncbi:acyltransferase [Georgenia sp. MJ206]|uniref:acyltransferase family protein n=1 Tax=Georgenia wangjunii TaxID=3117730 RepID=UPI002F2631A0